MTEVLVVIGLIIFLIGIFWKFILIGVGLIFGIFLLVNPNNHNNKIVEPHIVAENSAPTQFIIDCRNLLGKTTNRCNEMWFNEITVNKHYLNISKTDRMVFLNTFSLHNDRDIWTKVISSPINLP